MQTCACLFYECFFARSYPFFFARALASSDYSDFPLDLNVSLRLGIHL